MGIRRKTNSKQTRVKQEQTMENRGVRHGTEMGQSVIGQGSDNDQTEIRQEPDKTAFSEDRGTRLQVAF